MKKKTTKEELSKVKFNPKSKSRQKVPLTIDGFDPYVKTKTKKKGSKELSSLYKRLHVIPKWEKGTLFLLGMLTRVKLDQSLFENPQAT